MIPTPNWVDADAAALYLNFVRERHHVYAQRRRGAPQEDWTTDPVIRSNKFTNVYRVLDRWTQWPLKNLYTSTEYVEEDMGYNIPLEDQVWRTYLYRLLNNNVALDEWKAEEGRYPVREDALDGSLMTHLEESAARRKRPIWTGAYRIGKTPGMTKLDWVPMITQRFFTEGGKDSIIADLIATGPDEVGRRVQLLSRIPGVKGFLSLQFATDMGYSALPGNEDSFVIHGPGSERGAAYLTTDRKPEEVFRWARDVFTYIDGPLLPVTREVLRPLSLMDVQNTFCEFSKYMRFRDKVVTQKTYTPVGKGPEPEPTLPAHWAQD